MKFHRQFAAMLAFPALAIAQAIPQPDALASNIEMRDLKWALGGLNNLLVIKVTLKNEGTVGLTTVRLKTEQIQLVSCIRLICLGQIGLQGA